MVRNLRISFYSTLPPTFTETDSDAVPAWWKELVCLEDQTINANVPVPCLNTHMAALLKMYFLGRFMPIKRLKRQGKRKFGQKFLFPLFVEGLVDVIMEFKVTFLYSLCK